MRQFSGWKKREAPIASRPRPAFVPMLQGAFAGQPFPLPAGHASGHNGDVGKACLFQKAGGAGCTVRGPAQNDDGGILIGSQAWLDLFQLL